MDTDDLSTEVYNAVIIRAEKFNHDLTIQFGIIADDCKDETEYLKEAKNVIQGIRESDDWLLDDIFFGSPPDKKELLKVLDEIWVNILEVEKIPIEKRHYDF